MASSICLKQATSGVGDSRGIDGGKKIKGRKRHIITDSMGYCWPWLFMLLICMIAKARLR